MRFEIVTLFPELIDAFAAVGLIARGIEGGVLSIEACNPRQFATDKHGSVDDAPFGGGSGMVMMPEPLALTMEALDTHAQSEGGAPGRRILLTPAGKPFVQADAVRLSQLPGLMLICGRYEGIDDRVTDLCDEQLSLGDFVLKRLLRRSDAKIRAELGRAMRFFSLVILPMLLAAALIEAFVTTAIIGV